MPESLDPMVPNKREFVCHPGVPLQKPQGYAVWRWQASDACWVLQEDRSEPGYEPGPGPTQPGRFDGQVVKWASRARSGDD